MIVGSAERGLAVYESNNCSDCHAVEPNAWWGAPTFHGIWGSEITLTTGQSITVDEAYVRESIDDPYAKVREGLASDMASYEGRLSEQDYADFVAFLKTIRD
ncbi:MAG: hypothetical protein CMJ31_03620 [Phycisphaerae bacterium]|nr:hypothetical protein [Phycisphaerae bacterium]